MRIAFFSTKVQKGWGGSEELWSRAAEVLLQDGHEVSFNTRRPDVMPAPLKRLIDAGARPHLRKNFRLGRSLTRVLARVRLNPLRFAAWLRMTNPHLVVISLSWHLDNLQIANTCYRLGIPYVLLLQAAGANNWITEGDLPEFQSAYRHARQVYFVSPENRQTLESNLGMDLPHSEIVDNPFIVRSDAAPGWPSSEPFWRLAIVARVHFASKGQDLILHALRAPKWRTRPLKITLWGSDAGNLRQFQQLSEVYGLHNQVTYGGFADDIDALWAEHHALLLPSRIEGNALALIEAMLCGRVPIVTNVGRAAELIDDNESGFIAPAATVELIDEVLERAWQGRHRWREMGQRAAYDIRRRHGLTPANDFANRVVALLNANQPVRARAA